MKSKSAKRILRSLASATIVMAAIAVSSCAFDDWQTDLEDFVERGKSITRVMSCSYIQEGKAEGEDVSYGAPVTVTLQVLNPKAVDIEYTLSYDASLVETGSLTPIANTSGAVDGFTSANFSFTPTSLAEHGDIVFSVDMRSPTLNKDFLRGTVSVRCDSPPDPAVNLVAGIRSDGRACIGFALPEDYPNGDIVAVRIDYTSQVVGTSRTVEEPVSREGTNLTAIPDPALLDSDAGAYLRYFIPDDVVAGNPYTFTVVLIDDSGKESTPVSAGVTGNEIILAFNANGGTGTIAARFGYNESITTIPSGENLTRDHHVFTGWNTMANGSGASYAPDDAYTFTMSNVTLYAQWTGLGEVQVGILNPEYRTLGFIRLGNQISSIILDNQGTLTIGLGPDVSGATCQWYRNGASIPGATGAMYSFKPADVPMSSGTCVLSATATISGVTYSGDLTVTVTDDYMVTILPKGQRASYLQRTWTEGNGVTDCTHTLTRAYQIARYEVSQRLWMDVRAWAEGYGYAFVDVGTATSLDHPVLSVSDLDAMVWCNAYSEMAGLKPCYYSNTERTTVIRSTATLAGISGYSSAYVDWSAGGYRLPTQAEWHLAASCGGYYGHNHVSGCITQDYSGGESSLYANVHTGASATVNANEPNAWGIRNMSGNAKEYCFDRYQATSPTSPQTDYVCDTGSDRVTCGGSFSATYPAERSAVGFKGQADINDGGADDGFRLARSIP